MKRQSQSKLIDPSSPDSSGELSLEAKLPRATGPASGEQGWALLGLILALMVLGILLVSVVPNIRFAVQRDKEAEMIYRGEQMAEAIGRYYNEGRLGWPKMQPAPRYGLLVELKKLRDGVMLGTREIKFARPSALIDPMVSEEWDIVRFRDPRLQPFLQAFTAFTGGTIPLDVVNIAGPPPRLILVPSFGDPPGTSQGNANRAGGPPPSGAGRTVPPTRSDPGDPDDDDDPDDPADPQDPGDPDGDPPDPLAHIFKDSSGGQRPKSNLPIVGVAPRLKGPSVRSLYGLTNYEEWVFIFLPNPQTMPAGFNPNQQPANPGNRRLISP